MNSVSHLIEFPRHSKFPLFGAEANFRKGAEIENTSIQQFMVNYFFEDFFFVRLCIHLYCRGLYLFSYYFTSSFEEKKAKEFYRTSNVRLIFTFTFISYFLCSYRQAIYQEFQLALYCIILAEEISFQNSILTQ